MGTRAARDQEANPATQIGRQPKPMKGEATARLQSSSYIYKTMLKKNVYKVSANPSHVWKPHDSFPHGFRIQILLDEWQRGIWTAWTPVLCNTDQAQ